jgi:hypothetical protein
VCVDGVIVVLFYIGLSDDGLPCIPWSHFISLFLARSLSLLVGCKVTMGMFIYQVMPGGETNNSPVSEPVFLRVDMPETHIEAASGQEVRKEGEQAASPRQLHDSTKVSPKLSTPIVGTSAPSVTSSTLASSKMFSNTGWGLGSARAISVPFSTPLHMPETAASGHTLNAKAKADDHVQNQNSLTIASLSYKGGDVPAPGCGGEVSLPADFASSPHQQVLPSAGNPVGPLQETVLDLQMERPDTLPLQKSPLFAEATPSRETLSHTPTIDTDLVEDMSADPPNSRLSEMASCKAAEHKQCESYFTCLKVMTGCLLSQIFLAQRLLCSCLSGFGAPTKVK